MNLLDSTSDGFTPWWTRVTKKEFDYQLNRLKRVVPFCRGRAKDIRWHVLCQIAFLEKVRMNKFKTGPA